MTRFNDNWSRNEAYARWISHTSDAHKARWHVNITWLNLRAEMGMKHWEWGGVGLKKTFRTSLVVTRLDIE